MGNYNCCAPTKKQTLEVDQIVSEDTMKVKGQLQIIREDSVITDQQITKGTVTSGKQAIGEESEDIEKPKQLNGELLISKDLFVHLKKGSILNEYRMGAVLGEGAYGQVSRVIHIKTGIIRAMKTISKEQMIKEDEQKLFSEMNILKNLDHPNILRLYELYEDNKCYYLLTEYCAGGELFDKIKSMNSFTEKMAADYMKQILSAVVYLHTNKIVHRDLKPENLIFDSDLDSSTLKVIDFGTSKKYSKNKKMTKKLGTPYYIAPEVINQSYDEKCDVWSCGVILYIMLCGYPPFGGRSEQEIMQSVQRGKYSFDPEDWKNISKEAKKLIQKMLQFDPKKRISAQKCLEDSWIQKNAPATEVSSKALQSLSEFQNQSKIKQAVLTFIVSQVVSQQEKEELQKIFISLDKNGDGNLCKKELIEGYEKVYGDKVKAEQQVEQVMNFIDINRSDKIDFSEFLMAAMSQDLITQRTRIDQAFKMFDKDSDGYITRDELEQIMGEIDQKFWEEILQDCDTNKDGKISKDEFVELIIKNM